MHQTYELPEGGTISYTVYSKDEIERAWRSTGQGHEQAVKRGVLCVVTPIHDFADALELTALWIRNCFAIPTCVHFADKTVSFYCGDAGSGYQNLRQRTLELIRDFKSGIAKPCHGPLFKDGS
jgi:hypothetical protein